MTDVRIAIVGMSVQYAGCRDKEEFWDSLLQREVKTSSISNERLGTADKKMHMNDKRSKYSDTFCRDKYGLL